MSATAGINVPRLRTKDCWPVEGPHWSNTSNEHHLQADGSDWSLITPNGSTGDDPPRHSNQHIKAAMARRSVLTRAISHREIYVDDARDLSAKFRAVTEELEGSGWEDLAMSVSGVRQQVEERRQGLITAEVDELNGLVAQEDGTLGVLLYRDLRHRFMAKLGGFFLEPPEGHDGAMAQLGVTVIDREGNTGRTPAGYDMIGAYLRA